MIQYSGTKQPTKTETQIGKKCASEFLKQSLTFCFVFILFHRSGRNPQSGFNKWKFITKECATHSYDNIFSRSGPDGLPCCNLWSNLTRVTCDPSHRSSHDLTFVVSTPHKQSCFTGKIQFLALIRGKFRAYVISSNMSWDKDQTNLCSLLVYKAPLPLTSVLEDL